MAIRPIVIHGEPVLHTRASDVSEITPEVLGLISDMQETLTASHGVGLAAPQVGVGLRIFVWDYQGETGNAPSAGVALNPTVRLISKVSHDAPDPDEDVEGCLSAPGYSYPLQRSDHVEVHSLDIHGNPQQFEATGWFARIMQHETDHLDGLLYVTKLSPRYERKWRKVLKTNEWNKPGNSWLPGTDPDPFGHDSD